MKTGNLSSIRTVIFGLGCGLAGAGLALIFLHRNLAQSGGVSVSDPGKNQAPAKMVARKETVAKSAGADPSAGDGVSDASETLPIISDAELERRAFVEFPELKEAVRMNIRRSIYQTYGEVESILGVDAATAKRLLELLAEKQWSSLETEHHLAERGVSRSFPEHKEAMAEIAKRYDDQITAMLGDKKSQLLRKVGSIHKFSSAIQETYSADFRSIDEPLTPDQGQALAVVMAVNLGSDFFRRPGNGMLPDRKYLHKNEAAVLQDAKDFLSEKQLLALQSAFEDRRIEQSYRTGHLTGRVK